MRVLVVGSPGPTLPDAAWLPVPGPRGPRSRWGVAGDVPSSQDVARSWRQSSGAGTEAITLAAVGQPFLDAVSRVAPEALAGVVEVPDGADVPVALRRSRVTGTVYADASQLPAERGAAREAGTDARGASWRDAPRSSGAVGRLVALAVDAARASDGRPGRVVLATGGARSHDAGAGMVRVLAGEVADGGGVGAGRADAAHELRAARDALGGARLVAAVATDVPLLGLHGASATLADHGVDGAVAQDLERELGAVAARTAAAVDGIAPGGAGSVVGRDLLARADARLAGLPGAGSGGGLGFAVAALGGQLTPALHVLAHDVGLDALLADADLAVVVTAEVGAHELGEGAVREVAARAAQHAVPVIALARTVVAGRREQAAAGLSGTYAWGGDDPHALVDRVARTWARG
ncbi:glycerate kinase [Cellulosimicrobium arenosum]|uniref:Glycerate kinase n=1 Tax=Cellulosimicrobium arenosum TaxID=2708133 RepID=A0A927G6A4_9MICO|nr:glycerate kinase [Cellulosimicrobium arenosum]MBD8077555.1 glycerate kinase [Cellulosimicrobium arenosum]